MLVSECALILSINKVVCRQTLEMRRTLVYKYRLGDKETFERDLNSIEENCFFAPCFDKLNDPCETLVYSDDFNFQTGLFTRFLKENSKDKLVDLNNALNSLVERRKEIGIYSLSQTYNDELLWAHYANSHYGFCIEYDLNKLLDLYSNEKLYSFPVRYLKSPPQINLTNISSNQHLLIIKKIAGTKSKRWKYEKEYRIIIDKCGNQTYNHESLTSIYFGLRMNNESKEEIMNRLEGRAINYYQMRLSDKSYSFHAELIKSASETHRSYMKEIPVSITNTKVVEFNIEKKEYNWVSQKGTIEIILDSKVDNKSIKWLAELIQKQLFNNADRIFMFYWIKEDLGNEICWATSHYSEGKYDIQINDFNYR